MSRTLPLDGGKREVQYDVLNDSDRKNTYMHAVLYPPSVIGSMHAASIHRYLRQHVKWFTFGLISKSLTV